MSSVEKSKFFFNHFPVPEYLLLSTSGIVLHDEDLKFVEFGRSGFSGALLLSNCAEEALEAGVIQAGVIERKEELRKILRDLKSKYGIKYTRATLPEEKAYLFTVSIDKVPQEGLRDAVAFILEENVPISLAEAVFDYEVVGEAGGKLKVAVAVVPQSVATSYIDIFESSGIIPVSFDIESQAVARAVVKKGDVAPQLIVNLGERRTGLYVVEREVVQFSTTLNYGAYGVTPYPDINDLRSELRKLLAFWNTRIDPQGIPEKKIEKIVICGSAGSKEDFIELLLKDIEISYTLPNVWVNVFSFEKSVPEISFENSLGYAGAIGLALGEHI